MKTSPNLKATKIEDKIIFLYVQPSTRLTTDTSDEAIQTLAAGSTAITLGLNLRRANRKALELDRVEDLTEYMKNCKTITI